MANAYRVSADGRQWEPVVFDVPGSEGRADSLEAYEAGASEPFVVGLSSVIRSGLLSGLDEQAFASIVATGYDVACRDLMKWLEPAS